MARSFTCPRCQCPLGADKEGRGCTRCGGVFLKAHPVGRTLAFAQAMEEVLAHGVRGATCPACGSAMLEMRVAHQVIDQCSSCGGVWLDGGESLELPTPSTAAAIPGLQRCVQTTWWEGIREALAQRRRRTLLSHPDDPLATGYRLVEAVFVPNSRPVTRHTRCVLADGRHYLLEVTGTFSNWSWRRSGVDACYCYARWRVGPEPQAWLQLRVDDQTLFELAGNVLPFNRRHVYRVPYVGRGGPVRLLLTDAQDSWEDNSGGVIARFFQRE